MNESRLKRLRILAHEYYLGKLSYEAYRSQRTEFLDSLTQQAADNTDDTNISKTQRIMNKTLDAGRPENIKSAPTYRRQYFWINALVVLLVIMLIVLLLIWNTLNG